MSIKATRGRPSRMPPASRRINAEPVLCTFALTPPPRASKGPPVPCGKCLNCRNGYRQLCLVMRKGHK